MTFAHPYFFALLALIPLLLLLKQRRGETPGAGFSSLRLLAGYRPTWRVHYRWLPTALRAFALALIVVAIARPQTGEADSLLPGEGIDIALALDTSGSMTSIRLGDDTRLGAAQDVLKDFITGRQEDRLGLVIFKQQSLVLSPLTLDYDALTTLVDSVSQVNIRDGTAIGVGLADAINLLRESKARSRVVVLLTDGDNNAGSIEPLAAARIAETLGVRVYTIGVINPEARQRGDGSVDEIALAEMATLTGGRYFPAESEDALQAIYESIDALEKSRVGRPQFASFNELAVYSLVSALLLLALELGLQATVWRRTA